MEIDKTTVNDLSIFNTEEAFSIFNKLNFTRTAIGKAQFKKNLSVALPTLEAITDIQNTLKFIIKFIGHWPLQISNGTIMVVQRFYETAIDPIPSKASSFSTYSYKLMHGPDFALAKYSASHCFDFIKGMQQIADKFCNAEAPATMEKLLNDIKKIISKTELKNIEKHNNISGLSIPEMLQLAYFFRYSFKHAMEELLGIYAQLDAWYGMARSIVEYELSFPEIFYANEPIIEAKGLYHILLSEPVTYDITLNKETNFLFLTGANMAGKSTFIKAVGTSVFLAHTGMGVPAKKMRLSLFHGMLSNINVVDNISKGESYFYNEVQRIKATIQKINDGKNWLILIDELFKGTNVQDAMKCSTAVIEGLLKIKGSIFILSTHLYEIGEALKTHPNIRFNYFETMVKNDQLNFNYQLREGVSNDRLGYLILKNEGVIKMLEDL